MDITVVTKSLHISRIRVRPEEVRRCVRQMEPAFELPASLIKLANRP